MRQAGSDIRMLKRTKIVCTLGPSSDDEATLRAMIQGGMNVARLNLSHGTRAEHLVRMSSVRRLSGELGEHVAVMVDTRGPDVRIGDLETETVELLNGAELTLTGERIAGNAQRLSVSFPDLPSLLASGDIVYLDDGMIELEVIRAGVSEAVCRVVAGGTLRGHKGVNCPGKSIPLPILTDEDIADLEVMSERGADYLAASFVRTREDVREIRATLGGDGIPIIAKIESASGVENLEAIIDESDGVMVARGDLGVEIPPEEVPGVQKRIIETARRTSKPVITATEMLESMVRSPRPTRAEIADIANAVLGGTSAVMLSEETAVGAYPVEAVRIMARVCRRAEQDLAFDPAPPLEGERKTVRAGIAHAGCLLARDIGAPAIICVTDSGATAAILSHYRAPQPVLACTPHASVARKLSMYWGVLPIVVAEQDSVEELLDRAVELGKKKGLIAEGDRIVFTGNLSGRGGETNLLASVTVGA